MQENRVLKPIIILSVIILLLIGIPEKLIEGIFSPNYLVIYSIKAILIVILVLYFIRTIIPNQKIKETILSFIKVILFFCSMAFVSLMIYWLINYITIELIKMNYNKFNIEVGKTEINSFVYNLSTICGITVTGVFSYLIYKSNNVILSIERQRDNSKLEEENEIIIKNSHELYCFIKLIINDLLDIYYDPELESNIKVTLYDWNGNISSLRNILDYREVDFLYQLYKDVSRLNESIHNKETYDKRMEHVIEKYFTNLILEKVDYNLHKNYMIYVNYEILNIQFKLKQVFSKDESEIFSEMIKFEGNEKLNSITGMFNNKLQSKLIEVAFLSNNLKSIKVHSFEEAQKRTKKVLHDLFKDIEDDNQLKNYIECNKQLNKYKAMILKTHSDLLIDATCMNGMVLDGIDSDILNKGMVQCDTSNNEMVLGSSRNGKLHGLGLKYTSFVDRNDFMYYWIGDFQEGVLNNGFYIKSKEKIKMIYQIEEGIEISYRWINKVSDNWYDVVYPTGNDLGRGKYEVYSTSVIYYGFISRQNYIHGDGIMKNWNGDILFSGTFEENFLKTGFVNKQRILGKYRNYFKSNWFNNFLHSYDVALGMEYSLMLNSLESQFNQYILFFGNVENHDCKNGKVYYEDKLLYDGDFQDGSPCDFEEFFKSFSECINITYLDYEDFVERMHKRYFIECKFKN